MRSALTFGAFGIVLVILGVISNSWSDASLVIGALSVSSLIQGATEFTCLRILGPPAGGSDVRVDDRLTAPASPPGSGHPPVPPGATKEPT
jgi:hypothetical protein